MVSHPSEKTKKKTITLTATYDSLDEIRDFVARSARACGLIQNDVYAVQLAVDEAFTNIIEHAFGGETQEKIKCTCEIGATCLTVSLRDCGRPFNPDEVSIPDLKSSLEERPTGGLGLYFMRKLMDEVRYEFVPPPANHDGCNILTMVKYKERTA